MTEPTIAIWVTAFSGGLAALLGVDYYALIGAAAGVLFTVSATAATSKLRLALTVAITTFVAAVAGAGLLAVVGGTNRAAMMALCLLFGGLGQAGLQLAVRTLGEGLVDAIKTAIKNRGER